jgi:hypothetical protein
MKGRGRFMPGQAYVAVSRVKTEQGLHLLGFDSTAFRVNPAVQTEMTRLRQHPVEPIQPLTEFPHDQWLKIRLLNIRSYLEHLQDLKNDPILNSTDVLCLVETFLKEGQHLREDQQILQIATCFRADRPLSLGRGGGLMTFASTELSPFRFNLEIQGLEYLALAVTKNAIQVNIVTIYKPPSISLSTFDEKFQNLVNQLQRDILTIILGDFNIDLLQSPNHDIVQYMNHLGFYQFVKLSTTDYGSILDHVYINRSDLVFVEIVDTYYSDHDLLSISLNVK